MVKKMSKYGEALGVWEITVGGAIGLEVIPKKGDNRKLIKIMTDEKYKKDTQARMIAMEGYLVELIKRDNPNDDDDQIETYVEFNLINLIMDLMVKFRYMTQKDLEKMKVEQMGDIKKLTGEA